MISKKNLKESKDIGIAINKALKLEKKRKENLNSNMISVKSIKEARETEAAINKALQIEKAKNEA